MTLERTNRHISLPFGKGTLDLDAPTDHLGLAIANLRDIKAAIDTAVRDINDELIARADKDASYTYRGNGVEITLDGPGRTDITDPDGLRTALLALVEDDVITVQAVDAAVQEVVTFKASKRGLGALKKLGGRVADVIAGFEQPTTRPRAVRVTIGGPR